MKLKKDMMSILLYTLVNNKQQATDLKSKFATLNQEAHIYSLITRYKNYYKIMSAVHKIRNYMSIFLVSYNMQRSRSNTGIYLSIDTYKNWL